MEVYFTDANNGTAVGDASTILRTTNGGVTFIEDNNLKFPKNFVLYQNFPNPFNPLTTISFSLPKNQEVELKIFDILGEEIKTLVNDFKEIGSIKLNLMGVIFQVAFIFIECMSEVL